MSDPSNAVVQSLWIGGRLTTMERLAIASFLKCGHAFHLYAYDEIENVPSGTVVLDGNAILPRNAIFTYREGFNQGSPAAFSNLFRYELLYQRGGWWVDTDVVCLRYLDFSDMRVLASEHVDDRPHPYMVASAVIKVPAGDPLMRWLADECRKKDLATVRFGELGPNLIEQGLEVFQYHQYLRAHSLFCSVPYYAWQKVLDGASEFPAVPEAFTVHLWHAMWRDAGIDRDATYPPDCLYERLKRRFL